MRRKNNELTGLTLTKHIQLSRLKVTSQIIETSSKTTVLEVAYALGFGTAKYFTKLFKHEYGMKQEAVLISSLI